MNCKVCGITSAKNTAVSFFRFPKDNTKCRDWAERCDLLDLYEKHGTSRFYKSFRICSDHFYPKDIIFDGRKKRLLQSAVPHMPTDNLLEEKQTNIQNVKEDKILKLKLVENLCRLCATESSNLTDIYGQNGRVLNLESKLKYIPLVINKCDVLPLRICIRCISKVNQFHDFIINCIKAESNLRILLDLEVHEKPTKVKKLSVEPQENTEIQKKPNSPTPTILDLPNLMCLSENVEDDYYDKVLKDDFLNKEESGCFYKQPQPDYAMTNQLVNHTNFIKEVDFSGNITFDHDYSNKVTRDQLLLESEFQTENAQNFIEEITYHCATCLESFCSIEVLNMHSLTHTVKSDLSRELTSEPCNKVLYNKFEFDKDISAEEGGNHACKICDKKFLNVAFLKKHSIIHQLENPWDCYLDLRPSETNPEFDGNTSKTSLKHDRKKSDIFFGFNQNSKVGKINFKSQKRKCQFCDKFFKNRQICLAHERSHTGETPYQCNECEKTFRSRASLRQHRSVHSDKRLHNCQECGMNFKRKDTLSNHMRIHTGERPFICKVCGFAFKQRGDCIKHEKNHQKTSKTEEKEENLWAQTPFRQVAVDNSSPEDLMVEGSEINEETLWKEEKNQTLPPYITIIEESTSVASLEHIVHDGRISFNF